MTYPFIVLLLLSSFSVFAQPSRSPDERPPFHNYRPPYRPGPPPHQRPGSRYNPNPQRPENKVVRRTYVRKVKKPSKLKQMWNKIINKDEKPKLGEHHKRRVHPGVRHSHYDRTMIPYRPGERPDGHVNHSDRRYNPKHDRNPHHRRPPSGRRYDPSSRQ